MTTSCDQPALDDATEVVKLKAEIGELQSQLTLEKRKCAIAHEERMRADNLCDEIRNAQRNIIQHWQGIVECWQARHLDVLREYNSLKHHRERKYRLRVQFPKFWRILFGRLRRL